ncbi:MAG TPA: MFS transporter [Anaerolineae bacterium]|nr:MFS transporter [Anaerolineae bacterium]
MTDNLAGAPRDKAVGGREFQAGRVLIVAAGHMLHDTFSAFLSPLLPVFIKTLSLSNAEAGLLDVFLHLPSFLQPFIGYAADRVNLRHLFFLAPAVTAATMSCLTLAPSYSALALLLLVAGVSVACFHSVGLALAGSLSGRRLGWTMSFWMVGGTLGFTLGPIAVVSALRLLGPQRLPWLMLGGLLGSVLLYIALKDIAVRSPGMQQGLPWRQALRRLGPVIAPLSAIVVAQSFVASGLRTYLPLFMSLREPTCWWPAPRSPCIRAQGHWVRFWEAHSATGSDAGR